MMFSVSISSSDDELQLGHDEDKKKLAVHSTAKRKHSSEPAFIPQDESELDSPKSDFSPVIHPLKRKYEAVTVGDSKDEDVLDLPGDFSSPIMKKPHLMSTVKRPSHSFAKSSKVVKRLKPKAPLRPQPLALSSPPRTISTSVSSTSSRHGTHMPAVPARRRSATYKDRNNETDSDDEEDEDYQIPDNERATVLFDFNRERDKRLADVTNIPEGRYTEQEKDLFLQLAMRGFEPLAPKHWQFDFPTLPDSLFPEEGKRQSEPIITISRSTTFYAIKSLNNLFSLSGRVRDCSIVEKNPETLIKQTISRYIRWALYDANLEINRASMPIHVLHAQKKNESVRDALERLNRRLKKLALRHRMALAASDTLNNNKLPLLIGFLICGPVVALMTFDLNLIKGTPEDDEMNGKFFSQFDFSEKGQDVWNSLSIAIVVMHIRSSMVRLARSGYGGYVKSLESSPASEDL
ncbi:hypothetical protein AN0107.2 [Aspergillus nidulans FGSC A4]|nr:hypothetical protein AN0107.2 [Aspergillus nidulans FGSC A4]|eukprot:XP_657711.1 hypothetical protein AN0107.2 [Aspergillus nidulans FGSC A4]